MTAINIIDVLLKYTNSLLFSEIEQILKSCKNLAEKLHCVKQITKKKCEVTYETVDYAYAEIVDADSLLTKLIDKDIIQISSCVEVLLLCKDYPQFVFKIFDKLKGTNLLKDDERTFILSQCKNFCVKTITNLSKESFLMLIESFYSDVEQFKKVCKLFNFSTEDIEKYSEKIKTNNKKVSLLNETFLLSDLVINRPYTIRQFHEDTLYIIDYFLLKEDELKMEVFSSSPECSVMKKLNSGIFIIKRGLTITIKDIKNSKFNHLHAK